MTPEQKQQLLQLKAQGMTKRQAFSQVFRDVPSFSVKDSLRQDLGAAATGLGQDIRDRFGMMVEGHQAQLRGEQTPFETGGQWAGNIIGGIGDVGFRAAQAAVTPFMSQREEEAVAGAAQKVFEPVGEAISKTSPRTQRNIMGGLGLLEGLTTGVGTTLTRPATFGIRQSFKNIFRGAKQEAPKVTPENIIGQLKKDLEQQSARPDLDPRAQEEAANAALTLKERYIGLTPDVKTRLGEMGPEKLKEYLDAAHMRNISDTNPTPYEVGSQNVSSVLEELDTALRNTGSDIGKARQKLAGVQAPKTSVDLIEAAFLKELDKLNLQARGGQIVQKPGTITKTGSDSDIRLIQKLYGEMLVFKQSPTLQNAIDLRMAFDGNVKFGKSAREVSNSIDPLSRTVRKSIADEAAKIVGKENAAELKRYSDFMEAYGDLKSFTDRAAGGEYLLRLVLSGRGGEARRLIETVKEYTGVDLMNDATAMKVATELISNEQSKNLFRQEVTRAGYDAAAVLSGSPTGILQVVGKRLLDYGIDAEDVLKAAAAGTGGYMLMAYSDENGVMLPAGIAILSAMPSGARKEAFKQASKLGKPLKLSDEMRDETLTALIKSDTQTPVKGGKVDMDDFGELDRLKELAEKPKGLTDQEFVEARAILEKYDQVGKAEGATPSTNLLENSNDYLYHGTSKGALETIKTQGIVPQRRGVSSFSTDEAYSRTFADQPDINVKGEMLRVRKDFMEGKTTKTKGTRPQSDEQFEVLTKETIPPEAIEIFEDGKWQPLVKPTNLLEEAKKYKSAEEKIANKLGIDAKSVGKRDSILGQEYQFEFGGNRLSLMLRETDDAVYLNTIDVKNAQTFKQVSGTGKGTEAVNALREYADETGKTLYIVDSTNNALPYWNSFNWLEQKGPMKVGEGKDTLTAKNNFVYKPSSLLEEAKKYKSAEVTNKDMAKINPSRLPENVKVEIERIRLKNPKLADEVQKAFNKVTKEDLIDAMSDIPDGIDPADVQNLTKAELFDELLNLVSAEYILDIAEMSGK